MFALVATTRLEGSLQRAVRLQPLFVVRALRELRLELPDPLFQLLELTVTAEHELLHRRVLDELRDLRSEPYSQATLRVPRTAIRLVDAG